VLFRSSVSVPSIYIAKNQPFVDTTQGINSPAGFYFTNYYQAFNGTSAACPIIAGILATYVSQNPTATPAQAKQWLLTNAVSGNIMETSFSTLPVSSYDGTTQIVFDMPFASANKNNLSYNGINKIQNDVLSSGALSSINIDDILYNCRFFNTNNLVAQAYPLRKAVEYTNADNITIAETTLTRGNVTTQKSTHPTYT
jgi:subtilisin family serine protease